MDKLVGADNNYLSKLICPECIKSAFSQVVTGIEQKLADKLIIDLPEQSVFDVTLQTFSKEGNRLEIKYDAETAKLV